MFFLSPLLEDFMGFGLESCLLSYLVPPCVVPLLDCTNSINAATDNQRKIKIKIKIKIINLKFHECVSHCTYTLSIEAKMNKT